MPEEEMSGSKPELQVVNTSFEDAINTIRSKDWGEDDVRDAVNLVLAEQDPEKQEDMVTKLRRAVAYAHGRAGLYKMEEQIRDFSVPYTLTFGFTNDDTTRIVLPGFRDGVIRTTFGSQDDEDGDGDGDGNGIAA